MENLSIVIRTKHDDLFFVGTIHEATTQEDLHFDPVTFYEQYGKTIPALPQLEIEITSPEIATLIPHKLHITPSRHSGKPFVCYPLPIPNFNEARKVFRIWALGSAATMIEKIDLNVIFSQCKNDGKLMEKVLLERYSIRAQE